MAHLRKLKPKYAMAIRFIAQTGIRVGELGLICASDCALGHEIPYVTVATLKKVGHPKRRVDLRPDLAKALAPMIRPLKPGDQVFPMSKRAVQLAWERVQKVAGAKVIRPIHALRHTHFTRLAEMGVDPRYSQSRAGWSSIKMYEVYAHVTDTMRKKVAQILPEF